MENIRLLEDEEFIQENSDQITSIKEITTSDDEESIQSIMWKAHLKTKTLQIPRIVGAKEDWIPIAIIMKTVGELKDKDDLQLYLKIIMY